MSFHVEASQHVVIYILLCKQLVRHVIAVTDDQL